MNRRLRFAPRALLCFVGCACSEFELHGESEHFEMPPPPVDVALNDDYYGTRFWATTTSNLVDQPAFSDDFGIVIANPTEGLATVSVKRAGVVVNWTEVPAGESRALVLPMIDELSAEYSESVLVQDAAYEVESNLPVAAYQFNPLHFESDSQYSFSNDASLLIPEHVLGTDYVVAAYPSSAMRGSTGLAAIVATQDDTHVEVVLSASTLPGDVSRYQAGETLSVDLDAGEVLQLLSAVLWDNDLTGSVVTSDRPISVIGGHSCANVPDAWDACDHLEEVIAPSGTWGTEYVMTAPAHPDAVQRAVAFYRVVALEDGTHLEFSPAVAEPQTLDAGEVLELTTDLDFVVTASSPILPMQYLIGAALTNQYSMSDLGDPSMSSGVPMSQARDTYVILTPDTYEQNWINVVVPNGSGIRLDGSEIAPGTPVGSSSFWSARIPVAGGAHRLQSTDGEAFTVTAYGYASYTSYAYPVGRNFVYGEEAQ